MYQAGLRCKRTPVTNSTLVVIRPPLSNKSLQTTPLRGPKRRQFSLCCALPSLVLITLGGASELNRWLAAAVPRSTWSRYLYSSRRPRPRCGANQLGVTRRVRTDVRFICAYGVHRGLCFVARRHPVRWSQPARPCAATRRAAIARTSHASSLSARAARARRASRWQPANTSLELTAFSVSERGQFSCSMCYHRLCYRQ